MSHTCHAQGSSVEAPPKLFMCKRMVHAAEGGARRRVKHSRPGQENDKRQSQQYLIVAAEAIDWLANYPQGFLVPRVIPMTSTRANDGAYPHHQARVLDEHPGHGVFA